MIKRQSDGREFYVFSSHAHLGGGTLLKDRMGFTEFTDDNMVTWLDYFGVDTTVAFSTTNVLTDYSNNNDRIIASGRRFPDRIVPFIRINPHFVETAAESVSRYAAQGVKGIKLHPFYDAFFISDPALVRPIVEEANRHKMIILVHTGGVITTLPSLVWDLAMDFKDTRFIMAHAGGFGFDLEAYAVAKRCDNLWLDTSGLWLPDRIRVMIDQVGLEKALLGLETPYFNPAAELEKVLRFTDLSDDELDAVLGLNLAKLMGIDAPVRQPSDQAVLYPHASPMALRFSVH